MCPYHVQICPNHKKTLDLFMKTSKQCFTVMDLIDGINIGQPTCYKHVHFPLSSVHIPSPLQIGQT